jgi:hypothetical protein
VNPRGHPETLVAAQPANLNAVRQGVHSPRLIEARAVEIEAELTGTAEFSPLEHVAIREAARSMAILEAIDRDLDERGVVDKLGKPRYLLDKRVRVSRQLEQWLAKVGSSADPRTSASESPRGEFADYVRALQSIALGQDANASTRDRLGALKELLKLGHSGTTAYLEGPGPELTAAWYDANEEDRRRSLEERRRSVEMRD